MDEENPTIVAVAVSENRNNQYAVNWALQKFVPEGINLFKLLHVRPKITTLPSPNRKDMEWETSVMLLPYKQMCAERQVEVQCHIIEADDVAAGISEEIAKFAINKLVIGSSSRSALSRKLKGDKGSSRISQCAPGFCTVYVISKGGKLSSVRRSSYSGECIRDDRRSTSLSPSFRSSYESNVCSDTDSLSNVSNLYTSSLQSQRNQALRAVNQSLTNTSLSSRSIYHTSSLSLSIEEDGISSTSTCIEIQNGASRSSSYRSIRADYQQSINSDQASVSDNVMDSSTSENQIDISFELERLRIELKHLQGICEKTQIEKVDASEKMNELNNLRVEESLKLKEIYLQQMKARELATRESEAREAAGREAVFVRECAEKEGLERKHVEYIATCDAEEKERLVRVLVSCEQLYKKFDWEEIVSATSSFSDDFKIGTGANGTVYKGRLHHTCVAIKVLHSNEVHGTKQFQQELEILGRIRHPHLLLLLGACPDRGCLVYEYMENGSLDDRLKCKNNEPPLQWFHRYRIAWEVASALAFLHKSKPKPIVHRDLKPANILLDHNFVGKIGDVGLSTLLPANSSTSTICKETAPVGTFCYIDPEYQRTGVVSSKSDIYSMGMVILQLLTAKPPMGLPHIVTTAIDDGSLEDVLDSKAGNWPVEVTQELALLGLACAEIRRKDRPDLETEILPMLEKMKRIADDACDSVHVLVPPPSHFICPILQEVMDEPCVAADGYSYDRKAIEMWLGMNDKSPLTNLLLPNKNLIPNHSLLSAIKDWRSANGC